MGIQMTKEKTNLYKLTSKEYTTCNNTKWGEHVTHTADGIGPMCTNGWIHAYENPYLAIIMDPAHGAFGKTSLLWESKGIVGISDGLKVGCTKLTTIRIIKKPTVIIETRIKFAILCSLEVYIETEYVKWAHNWLNNVDRSATAAATATAAHAANAAYYDAAYYAAAYAADAAYAANAADAAYAAAHAAISATKHKKINFIEIINKCLQET